MNKQDITILENGRFSYPSQQECDPNELRGEISQLTEEITRLTSLKAEKEEILTAYEEKSNEQL